VEDSVQDLRLPPEIINTLRKGAEALGFSIDDATASDPRDFQQPQTYPYTSIRKEKLERVVIHLMPRVLEREYIYKVIDKVTLLGDVFRHRARHIYVCSENQQSAPAEIHQLITSHWPQTYQVTGVFIAWDSLAKLQTKSLDELKYELQKGSLNLDELLKSVASEGNAFTLTGAQMKQFHAALLKAFGSATDLKQLVVFKLGESSSLINENIDLSDAVFNLVEWAKTNGKLESLVRAAYTERPEQPDLRDFVTQVLPNVI
jgi:hypothetical protein